MDEETCFSWVCQVDGMTIYNFGNTCPANRIASFLWKGFFFFNGSILANILLRWLVMKLALASFLCQGQEEYLPHINRNNVTAQKRNHPWCNIPSCTRLLSSRWKLFEHPSFSFLCFSLHDLPFATLCALAFDCPAGLFFNLFTYLLFHKPRCWFSFIVDLIYFVSLCSIYGFWDKSLTGSLHYRLHKIWFIKVHFVFDVKANTAFDLPLVTWGYRGRGMFLIPVKLVPFDFQLKQRRRELTFAWVWYLSWL